MSAEPVELPTGEMTHLHVVAIYISNYMIEEEDDEYNQFFNLKQEMNEAGHSSYMAVYNERVIPGDFIYNSPYYERYFKGRWTLTVYSNTPPRWGKVIIKYIKSKYDTPDEIDYFYEFMNQAIEEIGDAYYG